MVIFGPAHAGKSTLAGYLVSKFKSGFNLERFLADVKNQLGNKYDEEQKYAYIVDIARDERVGARPKHGGIGTSRYVHLRRVDIENHGLTIIDTPGATYKYRERVKGMYLGEIGIFMIELSKLIKYDNQDSPIDFGTLHDFFSPLFLWLDITKQKKDLIIVISKMDELDFSESSFEVAIRKIKKICQRDDLDIIPISVNVREGFDHNVLNESRAMPWYNGLTLFDKLKSFYEKTENDKLSEPFFISVEKSFHKESGIILRGKVLYGCLKNESQINIAPVKYNKEYTTLSAKNKNTRLVDGPDINNANTGNLITIQIYDLKIEGKRCKKEDFDVIETCCIFPENQKIIIGSILQFKIPFDQIENFNVFSNIMIAWFGRMISSIVIQIEKFNEYGIITLELLRLKAALPLDDEGKFIFDRFLLKKEDKFTTAKLHGIEKPNRVVFSFINAPEKKDYINNDFRGFRYEILQNEIVFSDINCLEELIRTVKKFDERFVEESENLLSEESEELFSRIRIV